MRFLDLFKILYSKIHDANHYNPAPEHVTPRNFNIQSIGDICIFECWTSHPNIKLLTNLRVSRLEM